MLKKFTFLLAFAAIGFSPSCSTPEKTARATKGGVIGAAAGGLMGGWGGAAAGAAVTGLLGAATSTGNPDYGYYSSGSSPSRSTSGNTRSNSSGSMGFSY